LQASYTERQETLELFGYVVSTPLPEAEEIEGAVKLCRPELSSLAFPAYLLDCAHRLLAYNSLFPKMIGSRALARRLVGESVLAAWFDPTRGLAGLLEKPEEFYPMMMRAFKYEGRSFAGEEWYSRLVKTPLRQLPAFEEYWTKAEENSSYAVAARPAILLGLRTPGCGLLHFRLTAETFVQDWRFRLIYFLPGDALTIQQCANWAQENLAG
jgi:hypothetical protein